MKVAIIEPIGSHGGMNYYDFEMSRGLTENGVDVTLYTSDITTEDTDTFKIKRTFKKIWVKQPILTRALRFLICLISTVVDIRKNRFDLVHIHFFHFSSRELALVLLLKLAKLKAVTTVHDVESFHGTTNMGLARFILSICKIVIVHNNVSKNELIRRIGIPPNMIYTIPHGNYIQMIPFLPSKSESKKRLNLPAESKVILFFGQIKETKGLDILLNAISRIKKESPKTLLLIGGKIWKDDKKKYTDAISKRKIEDMVACHFQYIPDEIVPYYFCASDLVILPYKKIYQSGVLLKSMSYRKPVLVSNITGMTEIVEDSGNGFTFISEDEIDLSNKIRDLLLSPEKLNTVAEAGYQFVKSEFDWNVIGLKLKEAYLTLEK